MKNEENKEKEALVRVERHIILNNPQIGHICFLSKNLYNAANFQVRQEFFKNNKWLRYDSIYKLMKETDDYKKLPAQTAQQTLRLLDKNWLSFFRANKAYYKKPSSFKAKPKLPRYKHKQKGRNIVVFTNQQVKIKEGIINFPKMSGLEPIKTKVANLKQVRIIPQATCFVMEVVYEKEVEKVETRKNTYLSIDIGLNNLATCVNSIGLKPFAINGKPLKSMNQYFNKIKATLQSFIKKGSSNRIKMLTFKRNNKVRDYIHKTSRFIVDYCVEQQISNIVVGKNLDWKQDINLGKRTNQNFVSIPFAVLIEQIQYKAEDVGINVITQEESHTSKCSFLDQETVKHHAKYVGKRVKRGLFRSAKNIYINADVNGGYNILRKATPKIKLNALIKGVEGVGLHPVIITV